MAFPPLRQPKCMLNTKPLDSGLKSQASSLQNLILTMKDGKKFVLPSDSYHGILRDVTMYKCVFCDTELDLDLNIIELHKKSSLHLRNIEQSYLYTAGGFDNLVGQLQNQDLYCMLCNTVIPKSILSKHLKCKAHVDESLRALNKASVYKPAVDNKQSTHIL